MPRWTLPLAIAFLLLPAPVSAASHEAEGSLLMPRGVEVRGRVDLHGSGLLELERSGGDAGVTVSFAALAEGVLVDRTRDKVHVGLPGLYEPSFTPPAATEEPISADGPGRIENVRCGGACRVAIIAAPGEGLLGARGSLDAALAPTPEERVFSTAMSPQNHSTQLRHVIPKGTLELDSARFADPVPWVSGRVQLVVVDATLDLVDGGRRTTLDARWGNETTGEAAGQPLTVRHHARHAAVTLDGATLALAPGAPFRLSFPAGAEGRLDGSLAAPEAVGALTVAGREHAVAHESLLLEGALATRLTPPSLRGDAPGFAVAVEGEATRAVVSGVNVLPWLPSGAAQAGGGALAVVGLAALGRLFLAPLYHRLAPADLLANANRRRIYEAIRERPGVDVGALVAAVGVSRVLVRHHLRMLEVHRLVRATAWRRRRTYAVAGAALGVAACELKDPTRRKVAAAVARAGAAGRTQKDLSGALGLSQRLVSYHLARLGDAALVRTEGRNPRLYVATGELADALGKEDGLAPALAGEAALAHRLGKGSEGVGVAAVAAVVTTA